MCEVSKSGYYKWRATPVCRKKLYDKQLLDKMIDIREREPMKQCYGSPRMQRELVAGGFKCGVNRVAKIMRANGISAKIKRKYITTTDSNHRYPCANNLLKQQFDVARPRQVYASDITYVRTREGWLYLAVVIDLYSRRVVGWATDNRLLPGVALRALYRACRFRKPAKGAIVHSDRGSQYASVDFALLASSYKLRRSMSGVGNCYDNAVVESFFSSLKSECLAWYNFNTRDDAEKTIFNYIELFYNRERRHSTLGYLSPVEYEMAGTKRKTQGVR